MEATATSISRLEALANELAVAAKVLADHHRQSGVVGSGGDGNSLRLDPSTSASASEARELILRRVNEIGISLASPQRFIQGLALQVCHLLQYST